MSRYLADRLERDPSVEILHHAQVRELIVNGQLRGVIVEDNQTGERRELDARALFIFIGADPQARWLGDQLALDDDGFVLTGAVPGADGAKWPLGRPPFLLETSRPGVFSAGDVRSGSVKRVAAAAGEGSMAVRLVHEHLEDLGVPLSPWRCMTWDEPRPGNTMHRA
jgi:thioredoxin reductase (NADPH)